MIRNMWYAILESKEVKKNKITTVKRMDKKLVLWRDATLSVCCIEDRCCHRGASIGSGKLHGEHVECPFHGFKYDGDGKVIEIPANGKNTKVEERFKVNSYKVEDRYGLLWIWWGEKQHQYPDIKFFHDLKEGFGYATIKDEWNVHYTRAIENQLDVVHLPFVHHNTIGKGNKTLVNGPVVKLEDGDLLRFFVNNESDDGSKKPKKPNEIKHPENLFELQFRFPNIWQNMISKDFRIFAVFAPVDDENTVIYIRNYQRVVKIPIIKQIFELSGRFSNRIILNQDKRVVLTQIPKQTKLNMDEELVQGDLPIIRYRIKREELKKANGDT